MKYLIADSLQRNIIFIFRCLFVKGLLDGTIVKGSIFVFRPAPACCMNQLLFKRFYHHPASEQAVVLRTRQVPDRHRPRGGGISGLRGRTFTRLYHTHICHAHLGKGVQHRILHFLLVSPLGFFHHLLLILIK